MLDFTGDMSSGGDWCVSRSIGPEDCPSGEFSHYPDRSSSTQQGSLLCLLLIHGQDGDGVDKSFAVNSLVYWSVLLEWNPRLCTLCS